MTDETPNKSERMAKGVAKPTETQVRASLEAFKARHPRYWAWVQRQVAKTAT